MRREHMLSINTCKEILNRMPFAGKISLAKDTVSGAIYAVSTLDAEEQTVLLFLCQDQLTYDDITEKMGISLESIKALEKAALRKLRQPSRWNYIQYGVAGYLRLRLAKERDEAYRRGFAAGYQKRQTEKGLKSVTVTNMPVEMMELSYHSLSCLKRAGLHTVGELIALPEEHIRRIRGIGKKTAAEIANALWKLGVVCPPWDIFHI